MKINNKLQSKLTNEIYNIDTISRDNIWISNYTFTRLIKINKQDILQYFNVLKG